MEPLEELKLLENSATPAPWNLAIPEWNDMTFGIDAGDDENVVILSCLREARFGIHNDADARLIVALRNLAPEFIKHKSGSWQPIETAPMNRRILVFYAPAKAQFCVDAVTSVVTGEKGWSIGGYDDLDLVIKSGITHWRELPENPEMEGGE